MSTVFDAPETKVATPKEVHEIISTSIPGSFDLSKLFNRALDIHQRSEDILFPQFSKQDPFVQYDAEAEKFDLYTNDFYPAVLSTGRTLSHYAFRQLCAKIGVPARYIEKCLAANNTTLALNNINTWLKQYSGSMFVRSTDEEIRGLLSSRYSTLDSHDILNILGDTIDEDEYKIKGYFLSPERFHLRLVQREVLPRMKEDLFAGIQIDSSDVGRSVLKVTFMIFKLVCTNGMIVSKGQGTLFQQRHVGIEAQEFRESLSRSFAQIPKLVDAVTQSIKFAQMDLITLSDLGMTYEEQAQNRLLKPFNFVAPALEDVFKKWQTNYNPTRWGLINAITEHSQTYTLERRIEIEELAGRLLSA